LVINDYAVGGEGEILTGNNAGSCQKRFFWSERQNIHWAFVESHSCTSVSLFSRNTSNKKAIGEDGFV